MNNPTDDDAARRKRLLWRATHRGIKEMDLILGGFVMRRIGNLTTEQLDQLDAIIAIPDQEMLAWATGQEPVPHHHASALLAEILTPLLPTGEKEGPAPQAWDDEGT
jgi:antitoxin CptB